MRAVQATSTASESKSHQGRRSLAFAWLPSAVLGVGLVLGIALWSKWGFAVAFEAIRAYCF